MPLEAEAKEVEEEKEGDVEVAKVLKEQSKFASCTENEIIGVGTLLGKKKVVSGTEGRITLKRHAMTSRMER